MFLPYRTLFEACAAYEASNFALHGEGAPAHLVVWSQSSARKIRRGGGGEV